MKTVKRESKSGGDPEVINTVVRITLNALPREMNEIRNQLVVRKVGLPPLLVPQLRVFTQSLPRGGTDFMGPFVVSRARPKTDQRAARLAL